MKSVNQIHLSASRFHRAAATTIVLTSVLLAWGGLSGAAMAAMEAPIEGEKGGPKDWPANPANHKVSIKRDATDAKQSAMITAAEAAQVSKEELIKAAKQDAIPQGDKVWWYEEKLGTRIPYAITGDAITYYSDIVTSHAKKAFKSYAMPSSRLDYQAGVQFHKEFKIDGKTFTNVNVVTLKLSFSANFTAEATSGLSFDKKRIVVLDAENKVAHISSDGPTEALIMML